VTLRASCAAALLLLAAAARADLFSPGELSKPHAGLEGISNCTKCHPQGQQLSQKACLDCHQELTGRIAAGKGFHGRMPGTARDCWTCHHEHQGRDFAQVDWGPGGRNGFDHAKTGLPLRGKHVSLDCEKCHDRRLIQDQAVRSLLEKQPARRTFLGAPPACNACHFDEHRAQFPTDCARCHGEQSFKPAPGFDHAKSAYLLLGKHQRVACDKCHARVEDQVEHPGLLQPRARTFQRMKPLTHGACNDCHKDPHQGRFEGACTRCHTEADWKTIVAGSMESRAFHDRTRYRLEGAHAQVKCQACHGPFAGTPAQFKDLPFGACTDCHLDAHQGQMRRARADGNRCDRCHTLATFDVSRFTVEDHAQTRYPLEGAHRTVPCASCHAPDPRVAERVPPAARAELERRGRPVRVSLAVYVTSADLGRCDACHLDPHGGQFDKRAGAKGCQACHQLSSFTRTRFDHAKDTNFPLEWKHAKTGCASCHPPVKQARGPAQVKYTGVETRCAGCHADAHAAQFARSPAELTDCARCHGSDDWKKPLRFEHKPPFTDFTLTGKHLKAECKACHPEVREVKLAGDQVLRRYRGVPRSCQGCHIDFHKGAFRGFEP
jgi:hypothetical protein